MGKPAVSVEGLNELRRDLRRIADQGLKDQMVVANKDLAAEVINRALPHVPVLTGALRASVRGLGNLSGAVGKAGSARVRYAAAIHWGKGSSPGRLFLTNAAASVERDVVDRYMTEVDRLLDQVRAR